MWEAMRDRIVQMGGSVLTGAPVERLGIEGGRLTEATAGGESYAPDSVISSLPLRTVTRISDPPPPRAVVEAARGLRYRDFLTVALVLEGPDPFPDNWIYVHEPEVRVARIQNYRSWSPWMVPDPSKSCVGLEYFCFEGDELWTRSDAELVELAAGELDRIGLAHGRRVERGYAVRVPKAYPIYDADYAARVATIRGWLDRIENLQQVGRNGLHRYNNSDHSMLTAMCAVENLEGAGHDLWRINADSWYHETETREEHPYRRAPETPTTVGETGGDGVAPLVAGIVREHE
jgi:protoporphyrinogen oxidase